jgi:hypothetical protein
MGGIRPPKGSISADAKHLASTYESSASNATSYGAPPTSTGGGAVPPAIQSRLDKEANFQEAVDVVGTKMANDPESVTKEDAAYLESRERTAHGVVEKGGIAAQAQRLADKNEQ